MRRRQNGCTYGSISIEGLAGVIKQDESYGEPVVTVEFSSSWAGNRIPAYALVLLAESLRPMVQELEPGRLRPPVRFVPTSMVGGGAL